MLTADFTAEILTELLVQFYAPNAPRPSPELFEAGVNRFRSLVGEWFTPSLPGPNESIGVSLSSPKTAALVFDRVWSPPAFAFVPPEIAVYAATPEEVLTQLALTAFYIKQHNKPQVDSAAALTPSDLLILVNLAEEIRSKGLDVAVVQSELLANPEESWSRLHSFTTRAIAATLRRTDNVSPVPLYATQTEFGTDFQAGDRSIVIAALNGIAVVNEDALSWEQISEFRRDQAARIKFRRLTRWLDAEMLGKSSSEILDEIAVRVDDYDWATRKHGIMTFTGAIEEALDPKFIAAASLGAAAISVTSGVDSLLTAALTLGVRIAISVTKSVIDLKDVEHGPNSEVALIHAAKALSIKS